MRCARIDCGWTGQTCIAVNCPQSYNPGSPFHNFIPPTPSPRFLPVNIPFSLFGITVVTLDGHGNVEIKVDQPYPEKSDLTQGFRK